MSMARLRLVRSSGSCASVVSRRSACLVIACWSPYPRTGMWQRSSSGSRGFSGVWATYRDASRPVTGPFTAPRDLHREGEAALLPEEERVVDVLLAAPGDA